MYQFKKENDELFNTIPTGKNSTIHIGHYLQKTLKEAKLNERR